MKKKITKIIESLKDQKDIYGDDLYEKTEFKLPDVSLNTKRKKEKPVLEYNTEAFNRINNLDDFRIAISDCQKCQLGETRNKFVFGSGNPDADVLVLGEAPGAEEDLQGLPFVGRAGQLLTDILKAINFQRDEVFIANILKCRPPGNRNPLRDEMDTCLPYLVKQIELIKPKLILCLGLVAADGLLQLKTSLTKMRGNVYEFNGIKVMVTYHPAALLRNPEWKRGCWEDVKEFRRLYDEMKGMK